MDYINSYIGRVLNAISQLGNAVCGGANDISISARIGYNELHTDSLFYKVCSKIVDFTFYPLDGWNHCRDAYANDKHEDFKIREGIKVMEYITLVLLWLFCIPLSVIFWSYYGIKLLSKKKSKKEEKKVYRSAVGGRPDDRKGGGD